jgi:hypothetical protein
VFQPRNPIFWLMMVINALSYALMWIVQNRSLNTPSLLLIGGSALANAALGTWLLWQLVRDPPPKPPAEP